MFDTLMKLETKNYYAYSDYKSLIKQLLAQGKTTGDNHSDAYIAYTTLNLQRMHRNEKQFKPTLRLNKALQTIKEPQIWWVITEAWCGDAAQNLPALAAIAQLQPLIQLRLVLRDQNLPLMDNYLTNGARAIPKLIVRDAQSEDDLFVWGPRPAKAQELVLALKKQGVANYSEPLHKWYATNKQADLLNELAALIEQYALTFEQNLNQ